MLGRDADVEIILVDGVDELAEEIVDEIRPVGVLQQDSVDVEEAGHLAGVPCALVGQAQ